MSSHADLVRKLNRWAEELEELGHAWEDNYQLLREAADMIEAMQQRIEADDKHCKEMERQIANGEA